MLRNLFVAAVIVGSALAIPIVFVDGYASYEDVRVAFQVKTVTDEYVCLNYPRLYARN